MFVQDKRLDKIPVTTPIIIYDILNMFPGDRAILSFLEMSIDDACPWPLRWEARDTSHDLSGQGRTYTDVCAAHTVLQATMH